MSEQPDNALISHLERLQQYLKVDPDNLALLGDVAEAAYACGKTDIAVGSLDRYRHIERLPHRLLNLAGIVALADGKPAKAVEHFTALRVEGVDNAGVRFNLAWALSLQGDFGQCSELLDDEAMKASPRGPVLKVQALHHLGDLQAALREGRRLLAVFPQNASLLGAMSILAMDADDTVSARQWALAAPQDHNALTVLGLLALDDQAAGEATRFFDEALALYTVSPRALIGRGLVELEVGHYREAADLLTQGARGFGSHLGSWVASGWASLLAGDYQNAQEAFRRVLSIDDTFSEGHGGLAILALYSGDRATAARSCEIALRLDGQSLGGTLARVLLLQTDGKAEIADRLLAAAVNGLVAGQNASLSKRLSLLIKRGGANE